MYKKLLLSVAGLLMLAGTQVSAAVIGPRGVNIEVPPVSTSDDLEMNPTTIIQQNESSLTGYINLINTYLWFSISVVAMAVLVYGGYKLITANGDSAVISTANRLMMNAGIGIGVAMLAYTAIRVIVNLF